MEWYYWLIFLAVIIYAWHKYNSAAGAKLPNDEDKE